MTDTPRDIRMFVAAYEERSFTAAAKREHATQSGVSQHIRKLEDRFGVRLFTRGAGAVTPTPAADAYYRSCIQLLRAYQTAGTVLRDFGHGLEGEITIGLMPTMTRCALAPALARFTDQHPNVVVRIVEAYSAVLTQRVLSGELAFAVVPAFAGATGLKSRLFARTPEVLVAARGAPREHLAPVRLADLDPLRIILPGAQNTRRRTIESYCASNGVQIDRVLELDAMLGTLDLVATTGWVTILAGVMMARDRVPGRFTINPLADPPLSLDLILIESARRVIDPAASAFLEVLEQETRRINSAWD